MIVKDVVILKDVADDLNDGKVFHDRRNSVLVITSGTVSLPTWNPWFSTQAFTSKSMASIECLPNGFPMPFTVKL